MVFKDSADREWQVDITVNTIKRVRELTEIDLASLDHALLKDILTDPIDLCNVLYAIVKPQADAQDVTPENFGEALVGNAIERATDALLEALVNFFPDSRSRVLKAALAKVKELDKKIQDLQMERIELLDAESLTSGNISTSAPE